MAISREIAKGDRRSRRLHLEASGHTVLESTRPIVRDVQVKMMAGLSDREQTSFLKLLQKALDALPAS
mgnify:CR=1 FL=1